AKNSVAKTNNSLNSDDQFVVYLTLDQENAQNTKRFTFAKSSYLIDVEYIITNRADTPWAAKLYGQIIRDGSEPSYGYMGMRPYLGAAITT
ncbi:membrane protein insertase YidC, partial [Saccharophagus degradans]